MSTLASQLARAIAVAAEAHQGQLDKSGQPYILHPLHVMSTFDPEEFTLRMVAVLHDVIEDTEITADQLRKEFPESVVAAVEALSKHEGETYMDFIRRLAPNQLARAVKQRDLIHNMDLSRIKREPTEWELTRQKRYEKAFDYLVEYSRKEMYG